MDKKAMLSGIIAVLAVLTGSAAALATVKHEGVALKSGENPHLLLSGSFSATGEVGSLNCPSGVTATIELTGGTNVAHPKSIEITELGKCDVGGLLGMLCGTNSLTNDIFTFNVMTWSDFWKEWFWDPIVIDLFFSSCPMLALEGELQVAPDKAAAISEVALSGVMNSELGEFAIGGKLKVTPAGTYGY